MPCWFQQCLEPVNTLITGFQALLKSARHHYYPIFPCIWDILSSEKSALVWSEILRLFVNTLTADNKYSRGNEHHFAQQVQTPLSQKQKTFCWFFIAFLKCAWNYFRNPMKNPQKRFRFWDNGVWTCCAKLCTLQREYLLSAVNVLTNSLKISDQTNADFFQLNISQINGKIG